MFIVILSPPQAGEGSGLSDGSTLNSRLVHVLVAQILHFALLRSE